MLPFKKNQWLLDQPSASSHSRGAVIDPPLPQMNHRIISFTNKLFSTNILSPINNYDESSMTDLSYFRRAAPERSEGLGKREDQWTEVLYWEPRVFVFYKFLGANKLWDVLRRGRDKIIITIEKRIADYNFFPADHGEGLKFSTRHKGKKFEPHYDYFVDEFNTKNGGHTFALLRRSANKV